VNDSAWWYERDGQQAGPVTLVALQQLATSGELRPASRVWTAGMAAWARADTVTALVFPAMPPASPPPLGDAPSGARPAEPAPAEPIPPEPRPAAPAPPPTSAGPLPRPPSASAPASFSVPQVASAAAAVGEPEEIAIAPVILLSIVTLGIYGMIKFFQTGAALERLAGRETKFTLYFWLFVGLSFGGGFLGALTGGFAFPLSIAAFVFMFLALAEALRARREGVARWSLQVQLTSENTHYLFLALGILLAPVAIGFVFLVLQAVKWFEDWNALRAAALRRG
jgi:hypothetical protein